MCEINFRPKDSPPLSHSVLCAALSRHGLRALQGGCRAAAVWWRVLLTGPHALISRLLAFVWIHVLSLTLPRMRCVSAQRVGELNGPEAAEGPLRSTACSSSSVRWAAVLKVRLDNYYFRANC